MAALDPSLVQAQAATAWDAADGGEDADLTTEATNDTTGAGINVASASKIGKGGAPHGEVLRVAFDQDFAGVAVNDTITVEIEVLHACGGGYIEWGHRHSDGQVLVHRAYGQEFQAKDQKTMTCVTQALHLKLLLEQCVVLHQ